MVFYFPSGRPWRGRAMNYRERPSMLVPFWYMAQNAPRFWPDEYGPSHPMITRQKRAEAREKAQEQVPRYYRKLRKHVRHRAVVLYWQERTQRAVSARRGPRTRSG